MPIRKAPRPITVPDLPSGAATDPEVTAAVNAHVAAADPHPSLWQRIVAGFLSLTGGQRILRNNPPIGNTSFFGGANHIELTTDNGSNPILAFHKGGVSATSLYHSGYGNNSLRIRNADGYDSALLHDSNHVDTTDPHPQYLLQSEADARYRQNSVAVADKVIAGQTSATQGGSVNIPHGLDASKILSVTARVEMTSGQAAFANSRLPNAEFYVWAASTTVVVTNMAGNSSLVLGKPLALVITYAL